MEDKENFNNNDDLSASSMFNSDDGGSDDFGSIFSEDISEIQQNTQDLPQPAEVADDNLEHTEAVDDIIEQAKPKQREIKSEFLECIEDIEAEPQEQHIPKKEEKQPIEVIDDTEEDEIEETISEDIVTVRPVKFKKFEATPPIRTIKKNLDIMQDVSMHISVELGRTKLSIKEVMDFEKGSIVELNKIAGEQVEVFVNGKLVAKGEVIVIEDRFGVRITSTNITKNALNP